MKSVAQIPKSKPEQTVHTITPSTSVFDAVKLMAEKNTGALLVMEDVKMVGKLIGLISIGDLVKDIIAEQKFTIQHLEHYIMGDRG